MKILLHVCHHDLNQLTENNTISWSDLFNQHCERIKNNHLDLLSSLVDDLEPDIVDEESEQKHEKLEDEEQMQSD